MDRKEYEALLVVIEQTVETSVSRGAKHFREYRRNTHSHGSSDVDSGDPHLDAIGRLYRECFKGLKPDGTS